MAAGVRAIDLNYKGLMANSWEPLCVKVIPTHLALIYGTPVSPCETKEPKFWGFAKRKIRWSC